MPSPEATDRGLALIATRIIEAPAAVERLPRLLGALLERPGKLPRTLVTTGIGTSEGHARHLAAVATRFAGQSARFVPTGSLLDGAPPDAADDWLVVFSQGLSANARYALTDVERWGGVILVTGLPTPGAAGFEALDPDKRTWLVSLASHGVVFVDMECGAEYGSLIRVIGARVGYVLGWSLLRTLAARALDTLPALDFDSAGLRAAQLDAPSKAQRAFATVADANAFFAEDRTLLIVAHAGLLEYAGHLALKVVEGMLRPTPICVDVLEFAHGPLQSLAVRSASILYLSAGGEGGANRASSDWLEAFRQTLDPDLHDLRVLRAELPAPFCVVEFEAIFDALILRMLEASSIDLVNWPGRDREAALYDRAPRLATQESEAWNARGLGENERSHPALLAQATSPEIEAQIAAGRRTALVALGSIEQHGPHLPLATDAWIADALLEGLVRRLDDAIAIPEIALGCASEHLDFAGTLSLRPATLEALLCDVLDSLMRHGFRRVFLWTAHGGNVAALEAMRPRLEAYSSELEVRIDCDLAAVAAMQCGVVTRQGQTAESAGPHAGEYETSLIAAIRRGSVRSERRAPGRIAAPDEAQDLFYPSVQVHAPTGVIGDPSAALASRGEAYLEAWVNLLESNYRAAFAAPMTPSPARAGKRGGAKKRQ